MLLHSAHRSANHDFASHCISVCHPTILSHNPHSRNPSSSLETLKQESIDESEPRLISAPCNLDLSSSVEDQSTGVAQLSTMQGELDGKE